MERKDINLYNSCVVGNVHHVLISAFTVFNFINVGCDWYNSDACMMTPNRNFTRGICFTCGYLSYDFIVIVFILNEQTAMAYQMIYHHIVAVSGCLVGMHAGYGQTGIGNLSLMMEMSTIFMNYRSMLNPETFGSALVDLN